MPSLNSQILAAPIDGESHAHLRELLLPPPSAAGSLCTKSPCPSTVTMPTSVCLVHRLQQTRFRREKTLLELQACFSICGFKVMSLFQKTDLKTAAHLLTPHYLVVRNSMSLFAFSSISAAASTSSTSWVICGRFPLLSPRLMLEEVELELSPESGTGEDWSSLRKSKPPGGRQGQGGICRPGT